MVSNERSFIVAQSARIDYFRASTTDISKINTMVKGYFSDANTEPVKIPLYGYARTVRNTDSSAFYCFNPHTATMGNLVQFSGSPISHLMAQTHLSSFKAIASTGCADWKVTRLDVAIDYFDETLTMDAIHARIKEQRYKSKIRIWKREKEEIAGGMDIIRGGGKEALKSMKIYDKAAEQHLDMKWIRLEMTFMDARAREVWKKVSELSTDEDLLVFAKALMATIIDFTDWPEWQSAFGVGSKHEWTEIPRTESDTWRWLLRQVAPAFQKDFHDTGDWTMLEKFVEAVKQSMSSD